MAAKSRIFNDLHIFSVLYINLGVTEYPTENHYAEITAVRLHNRLLRIDCVFPENERPTA